MECKECGLETTPQIQKTVIKYEVPFVCTLCGGLNFTLRAINGLNYIWPMPVPALRGSIFIPEKFRINFKASIGVLLTSGHGCMQKSTGLFIDSWVKPGDVVMYDKTIPWQHKIEGEHGKDHIIDKCNILDILKVKNVDDDKLPLEALDDMLIVKLDKEPELSRGGIYVPVVTDRKVQRAKVRSAGCGRKLKSGKIVPMEVAVGDVILFDKYKGVEITTKEGEELIILKEEFVLAIQG